MAADNIPFWIPILLGVVGVATAIRGRQRIRGTTLIGPWWWTAASLTCVSLAAGVAGLLSEDAASMLRQAAATTTFCPAISLLGAKRPQDRGWHFVVLSLWTILTLPTLEGLLAGGGDMEGLRSVFVSGLIILGLINALPTSFWLPAILLSAAQVLLWLNSEGAHAGVYVIGIGLFVAAIGTASAIANRFKAASSNLDRLWLDFRNAYGLLWALRVAEQINRTAGMLNWDLRLTWRGFARADGSPFNGSMTVETERGLHQNLSNLLRRFVSADWIAERLQRRVD